MAIARSRLCVLGLLSLTIGILLAAEADDSRVEIDGSPYDWDFDASTPFSIAEDIFGFPGAVMPGISGLTITIPSLANTTAADITTQVFLALGTTTVTVNGVPRRLLSSNRLPITGCTLTVPAGFNGPFPPHTCNVSSADSATLISFGILQPNKTTQSIAVGFGPEARKLSFSNGGGSNQVSVALTLTSPTGSISPQYLKFPVISGATAPVSQTIVVDSTPEGQSFTVSSSIAGSGNWLSVNTSSTVTPATVTVTVNPVAMPVASYRGDVTVAIPAIPVSDDVAVLFTVLPTTPQFIQQGPKLTGSGFVGTSYQGRAASLSADGNTAVVGGPVDNNNTSGAAWAYFRSCGNSACPPGPVWTWTQAGSKLVGTGAVGDPQQGNSVAMAANASTAIIGGPQDSGGVGAVWVFTGSGGAWGQQQGNKLVGIGGIGAGQQGTSVALSADGNTAIVGGIVDNSDIGAAWVFTRSGTVWTQQAKLVGSGASGMPLQGQSVALSADGNTALIGGNGDNGFIGAVWVFTRSAGVWTQQGAKLVGTGGIGVPNQGQCVALSSDGNTALIGGSTDNSSIGAVWVFTRSAGVWTQQGTKLVGSGAIGTSYQGNSCALSADGNTAAIGGFGDNNLTGAAWVFTRSGTAWTQLGSKLVGANPVGPAEQGDSVAISGDGNTILVGGITDNSRIGAAWPFVRSGPAPTVSSVSPNSVVNGQPYTLTVSGSNFMTGAVVTWGGSALTTAYFSASQLTAALPALGRVSSPVNVPVLVINPDSTPSNAVNIVWNPAPSLGIVKTHSGKFAQGQVNATYTVTVTNSASAGPTSGTVTVTENVPSGLTLVSMSGTGWTCPSGTASCTRADVLTAGSSYPPIAATVNVLLNAPAQVTNQVSVSGGSSASASATDATNVAPCTVTVSPLLTSMPGTAGTLTLNMTGGVCGWTANSHVSWLTPTMASGNSTTLNVSVAANTTGAQRSGTITVNSQTVTVTQAANNPGPGPGLVSLNPFQGYGLNAILTLVYAHPNGWAAIQSAEFIINPRWEATNRSGGCYVKYAPGTGVVTLIADDGNGVAGATTPGSATNISNSQCTLNAASSSATGSGNNLTLVVSLTFSASFGGQRHIWMQAYDYNNISSNWLVYGVWFPTQTSVTAGPWYRIYDPFSNSYLYSADSNEYSTLGARGFVQQGISGLVMNGPTTVGGTSNIAWYRVYVNSTSSHFWTSDRNEFLTLTNQQQAYVGEGVAAFVMPYINAVGQVSPQVTNTIPFWRAAFQGANLHFWTSDANEYNGTNGKQLPPGYKGEGIACYIFPASGPVGIGTSAQFSDGTEVLAEEDGMPGVVSAVNGASHVSNGVIAPGQALTLYGRHLGGRVLMNGVAARVIAAQDNEIRLVVPKELAAATEVSVEVEHRGRRSKPIKLDVAAANPAIYGSNQWGRGNAQAQNEDGTINDVQHGAARGTVVTLYTTGVSLDLPVEVHIGGMPSEVISAQVSGTRAGVTEVRVRIPETVESSPFQPVVLHVGNLFSQPGVGLAIQ
jgi:uncharacterized protein (TIGR03437 family)